MSITNPTTIQLLTEARELMHQLISNGCSWQLRAYQERRINWLREQLTRENAQYMHDHDLLTSVFA
jgi:hypothetical protein